MKLYFHGAFLFHCTGTVFTFLHCDSNFKIWRQSEPTGWNKCSLSFLNPRGVKINSVSNLDLYRMSVKIYRQFESSCFKPPTSYRALFLLPLNRCAALGSTFIAIDRSNKTSDLLNLIKSKLNSSTAFWHSAPETSCAPSVVQTSTDLKINSTVTCYCNVDVKLGLNNGIT
jgi:hypothetical protein